MKIVLPALLFLLIAASGCKKFVDIAPPTNSITTTTLFANDVQANSAMAGIYSTLAVGANKQQAWSNGLLTLNTGLSSDEVASSQLSGNTGLSAYESARLTSIDGKADGDFWAPMFKMVDNANAIIEGATASATLADSARTGIVAESKFIRAFCFFYLTNLFGDIPLPLTSDFNKIALLARTPQADVYKQIIKDLIAARDSLPSNFNRGHGERIIPNKAAATALLARAYLYTKDWKDADAQATLLISDTAFSLVNDLTQVFIKNSRETIWSLQPSPAVYPYSAFDVSNFVPILPWASVASNPLYLIPSVFNSIAYFVIPTYYLYKTTGNAFEPGDRRKANWTGYTPTPNAAPYTGDTIFYSTKYPVRPSAGSITQYYMVLRLAEQYLIRAEAKAEDGDLTGAAADLNTIRSRAGLPPATATSQSDLLAAVMQERRVELFTEWGHRFFDLKRTGQAGTVIGAIPTKQPWQGTQLLYPIPFNEIKTDPNLVQNPGY